MNMPNTFFATPYLKGAGQIMLQESQWTGLLFLAGIFWASPIMGLATVLAIITGTLTAKLLQYDAAEIASGLYGFSAALVGAGLAFYFQPVFLMWAALIIGSAAATIIQHAFMVKKIPGYTFPFIFITWIIFFIFHHFLPVAAAQPSASSDFGQNILFAPINGFGEVMFVGSSVSSWIFLVAIFVCSPIAALYALFGSVFAASLASGLHLPADAISQGLFSFNAVLCAIVFAGDKKTDGVWVAFSVALALLIQMVMQKLNAVAFTFPFVLSTWLTLALRKGVGLLCRSE
jgi:urea transporter